MGFGKHEPGCKCCGNCSCYGVTTTDCPGTVGSPDLDASYYSISVTDLTDGTSCSSCDTWNGDFKLCWVGSDTWESEPSSATVCSHSDGDPLWRLSSNGTTYTLTAVGIGHYWEVAAASWNCTQTNTLTLGGLQPTNCNDTPNTIDVVPCLVCAFCSPDTDTPDRIQLDVSGVINRACNCADINGTFVLNLRPTACTWELIDDQDRGGGCNHPSACPGDSVLYRVRRAIGNIWVCDIVFLGSVLFCPQVRYVRTDADCTASGNMTFGNNTDNYFCQGWESATVTITPL